MSRLPWSWPAPAPTDLDPHLSVFASTRGNSTKSKAAALAAAFLFTLASGGCRTEVQVTVTAERDGTGEISVDVTLDEAAAAATDNLASGVAAGDLAAAGWQVDPPVPAGAGGVRVVARRPFDDASEAAAGLQAMSGEGRPFRRLRLVQDRSFVRTATKLEGSVDLRQGVDAFGDEDLARALGEPLSAIEAQLRAQTGRTADELLAFEVIADLPGDVEGNGQRTDRGVLRWQPSMGDEVELTATATDLNTRNLALAGVAAAALLLAAAIVIPVLRRR